MGMLKALIIIITLNSYMEDKYNKKLIFFIAWTISMSMYHFGYFLLYFNQIPIATLKQIYHIPFGNAVSEGIVNGCIPIGGLVGALSSSFFISRFSRRNNMLLCNAFLFLVGWLIFVQNFPMLIICRLCQGIGLGFFTSIAPLIISEISPINLSGALSNLLQLHLLFGVFIGCFAPYVLRKITGDDSGRAYWYLVFGIPHVVIVVQSLLLLYAFPYETPKYHLSLGDQEEARKLIAVLYKPQLVEEILQTKKMDLQHIRHKEGDPKDLKDANSTCHISVQKIISEEAPSIQVQTPRSAILVSIHLSALMQLSGINVVSIYSGEILNSITTGEFSLILPSIINLVAIIASIISYFISKHQGRRPIIIYGTLVQAVANILMMAGYFIKDSKSSGVPIILVGVFMFRIVFAMSVGPIVWLYISEVVQPNVMPLSIGINWISTSIVVILFPILTQDYLQNNPAFLFVFSTVWCLLSIVINYFFVIETKGKQQKQIREEFKTLKICCDKLK